MANADKNNQNASKALNQCLKELLIANEDENNEYDSGMLSPRRLEAIHIAFNEVFDTALKDGTVLDMSSYPPFEQVFEAAMRGESRVFSSEDNRSNLEPKSAEELHGVKKRNVSVRLDTGRSTNRRMGRNLSQKTSSASLFTNFKDNLASDSKRSANFAVEVSTAVKRPEHRQAEPERRFECGWPGCNKVYGFLNHLNSHIVRSKHGEKKHPNGKCFRSGFPDV